MSSGVRNLRAMFEQNAASSPEPRGRSPGSSSAADDTSRPTSKVRASFVSVENTVPHASDFAGVNKGTPSNSTAANRRESFSISEDTAGEVADLRKSISEEKEERRKSVAIIEAVPEHAVASRESSAGPPPVRKEPEGDIVNLGHIMKGSEFPETSADKDAGASPSKEAPAPELPAVKEEPAKEKQATLAPAQKIPAEKLDKATIGALEGVSLKPADPTDASAVSGGKALPPPAEELKPAETEPAKTSSITPAAPAEPAVQTPKPASSSTKANGTPASKGKLDPKRPAAISTTKASASKSTPVKSPLPRTAPKTPTNNRPSAAAPAPKAATPISKPAAATKPAPKPAAKEPVKAAAPKPKTSHTSLRQSTATAPTAAAKAKTVATETKKPAATKPRDPTSPPAFKKPKPKSPTRPVGLPSRLTAPTAASAAKLQGEEAAKVTRKPSTATRPVPKPAPAKSSRPSVAPSASTNKRPESRASTVGAKPGFLERMSRPTAASASKVHEKPSSPPRKAPVKASILQKGKKKVEEIAAEAKEAVTTNGHADESPKTEAANGTEAHAEASEVPAAEPTTESVPEHAGKAKPAEPVKAETPVLEGESSALELQTPKFQGEAIR
ncbi:uncharacterized protein M421DRAFT_415298 [Didymella exigua CBS 183.55]|uniref:Uncharacterized protein n=1 Tax=Didymella exigua CBS 183.55 TaxID=1150837 RepID=A0A6A5S0R0_9PLEO|nr:uncharacterized protein M421DRAFT_415298 [Didymella exigua CBS 183.55]KAF1934261.1 hypothetical protein M421DRAFT_415298 [Didymella exigua CBS 183.55]